MTANVLIVAPAWVGDMVMAHSLVRVLVEQPQTAVHLLAPPATAPLGARMPGVAKTHVLDVAHGELGLGKRRAWGRNHAGEFDRAIVLPNSFKSALAPWWARIPTRTGWRGECRVGVLNDRRVLDPVAYPRMVERFVALALDSSARLPQVPLPELQADASRARGLCGELGLPTAGGVTVLCPGAEFGPAKRWPAEHFAAVARFALGQGQSVWLMGSAADAAVANEIAAQVPGELANLCGRTSLLDAVDLLSMARRVVCNDSGLMHVACALQLPVVGVFGSTSPDFTPPLGVAATVVRQPQPCSPCFQRECPLGHLRCLRELTPDKVIEVL
jgi:heptosyltransferase-2